MTTAFPTESKCPKCGKLYTYLKVASIFVTSWNKDDLISLLNYEKICDCGEVFDMSKNETGVFPPEAEEYLEKLKIVIDSCDMPQEKAQDIVDKLCQA